MYGALYLPRFALQAALRFEGLSSVAKGEARARLFEVGDRALLPVVLVEEDAARPVVLEMTRAAEREGVQLGFSVPQAMARCGELEVVYRSAAAEALLQERLFYYAYSLAPRVERFSEGVCLVDLKGVGLRDALEGCVRIVEALKEEGLIGGAGLAESYFVALMAAKWRRAGCLWVGGASEGVEPGRVDRIERMDFLEALPLRAAEPSPALLGVLDQWGIRSVGAFAKLSQLAVGSKLGHEGLKLWSRVQGEERRNIAVCDLPKRWDEALDFEYDVDSLHPLLFLLRRFLDQLCLRLRVTHQVAESVAFELKVAYGEPIRAMLKVPEPSSEVEGLFRLAAGRMETIETDSPVVAFAVEVFPIAWKQRQLGLFESSLKHPGRFAQTLARVAGIVGPERVGRPVLLEDGRPDGFVMGTLASEVEALGEGVSLDRCYGMPLRRFRPPLEAAVELQGRQPVWFKCERAGGFVVAVRGPWMRSGHWWEKQGGWLRTEWDVELRGGGVYRLVREEGKWFVEGSS